MQIESGHHVLTVLYPLYKEEVYRRREQMMRLTIWGGYRTPRDLVRRSTEPVQVSIDDSGDLADWLRSSGVGWSLLFTHRATALPASIG